MAGNTLILCPGQGAQAVGMGKDFFVASRAAREIFNIANALLGYDLASICFDGPEDRLNQTDVSQPAIYTTSVACFAAAVEAGVIDKEQVVAVAGLSLGEYTALHLGRAMSFEDGLRLVQQRGRYMQEAAVASPSGMVALVGADEKKAVDLCEQAAEGEVLAPANFNAPGQIVVSGAINACGRVLKLAEAAGIKAVPLKVAGAFHSPLMQPAADRMARELEKAHVEPPLVPVYSNVTGQPHENGLSIKRLLVEQIVKPVKWEQTMQALIKAPPARVIELAPGRTLSGLAKRVNRKLAIQTLSTIDELAVAPRVSEGK